MMVPHPGRIPKPLRNAAIGAAGEAALLIASPLPNHRDAGLQIGLASIPAPS